MPFIYQKGVTQFLGLEGGSAGELWFHTTLSLEGMPLTNIKSFYLTDPGGEGSIQGFCRLFKRQNDKSWAPEPDEPVFKLVYPLPAG